MSPKFFPPALLYGDAISICAPASIVEKEYVEHTAESLTQLGYHVELGKHVFNDYNQFAGTDAQRLTDFQEALDNPRIRAIFCARGGYGSVRIIDSLSFTTFRRFPKWIVGFSDISVFHALINDKFHMATIHAPMPVNFESSFFQANLQQIDSILKGNLPDIRVETNIYNRNGSCRGTIVGGNLSILYSLQSTFCEVDTRNKILFFEDTGEQLYHLDRMMNNLRLSGKFRKLKGLIVGGMTDMQDKKIPFGKSTYEIIREIVEKYDFPVVFDFPAGHISNNIPFILGSEVDLVVDNKGGLIRYIH
jgi:muramoyltetrapeptide carboxypeptidase